ncbi:hypothetical protein LTS10_003538 [Elasticomyces elasticus]|nr:hypothetical protein LTS10_003538 [Elasticomyces elasticus]
MAIFDFIGDRSTSGGLPGALTRIFLRFMQFVLGVTVACLYAVDIDHAKRAAKKAGGTAILDGRWVYAEVVSILSIITVLVYAIPVIKSWWGFAWDWCLFILWTALFGIFGRIWIHQYTYGYHDYIRMKNAVWVDLVNMLLWLVTAVYTTFIWFRNRGSGRTLHTGRGQI